MGGGLSEGGFEPLSVRPALAHWPDWPEYGLVDDLRPGLYDWASSGHRFVLATLVEVTGSSPRPVGSEMAIREDGLVLGYVSGGCVEAAVAAEALQVLVTGRPRVLDYGDGSPTLDVRLTCGGRIRILLREPAQAQGLAETLWRARFQRQACAVLTDFDSGAWALGEVAPGPDRKTGPRQFLKTYLPVPRLVVVGGDPVALALSALAAHLGYELRLVRPKGPQAGPTPGLPYDSRPLESVLEALELDAFTAVVCLSHDLETDLAVLAKALQSPAFHLSSLGSRRKAELKRSSLMAQGFDAEAVARVRTPAGLHLGSVTPQEIALSILAQIVADRRGK